MLRSGGVISYWLIAGNAAVFKLASISCATFALIFKDTSPSEIGVIKAEKLLSSIITKLFIVALVALISFASNPNTGSLKVNVAVNSLRVNSGVF